MAMTQGAVKAFILANWYRTGQWMLQMNSRPLCLEVGGVLFMGMGMWVIFHVLFFLPWDIYVAYMWYDGKPGRQQRYSIKYVPKLLPFAEILLKHSNLRWCIMYRKSRRKKLKTTVCFCLFPEQKPRTVPQKNDKLPHFDFRDQTPSVLPEFSTAPARRKNMHEKSPPHPRMPVANESLIRDPLPKKM